MNKILCGVILALSLLIFTLIGCFSNYLFNKKKLNKNINFIYGFIFAILIMIVLIYLFPEVYNCLGFKHFYLFLIFLVIGFIIFKVIDNYLPDHDNNKLNSKEMKNNYVHIGIMIAIFTIIYNIVIGMELYSTLLNSVNLAVRLTINFAIKDIILGFIIYSLINQEKISKRKKVIIISLLAISTLVGVGIRILFNINSAIVSGSLFSLLIGIIMYILINELFPKIKKKRKNNLIIYGVICGVIILLITLGI